MIPNKEFLDKPTEFWAIVRYASELIGYSSRSRKQPGMKKYRIEDLKVIEDKYNLTEGIIEDVLQYINYRNKTIQDYVAPLLMNR